MKIKNNGAITLNKEEIINKLNNIGYKILSFPEQFYGIYKTKCIVLCKYCKNTREAYINNLFRWKKCIKCRNPLKYSLEEIESKALNKGWKIISQYAGEDNLIELQCLNCNSVKKILQAKNIKTAKCLCKEHGLLKYNKEYVENTLSKNNFKLLSNFEKADQYIEIECKNGHKNKIIFYEFLKGLKRNQTNCKKCFIKTAIKDINLVIKNIKNFYPNLELDTSSYQGVGKIGKFNCLDCNFSWNGKVKPIEIGLMGCPHCHKHLNEKLTGEYLKDVFNLDNIPLKYILNCNIQKYIAIDYHFYFKSKLVFVEYNGAQHYRPINFGYSSEEDMLKAFQRQKERDKYVREYCKNNDILLIEIDGRKYTNNKIKEFLINEKEKLCFQNMN